MRTSSQLIITAATILMVLFVVYLTLREGHRLTDGKRDRTEKVVYY